MPFPLRRQVAGKRRRKPPRADQHHPLVAGPQTIEIAIAIDVGRFDVKIMPGKAGRDRNGLGHAHADNRAAAHHPPHVRNGGSHKQPLEIKPFGKGGCFRPDMALQPRIHLLEHDGLRQRRRPKAAKCLDHLGNGRTCGLGRPVA